MIDEEFRSALQDRLGPALDGLVAPDLLDGVRARQVRHQRSVRAGLAFASVATVTGVVVAVAVWPSAESASPSAPTSSAVPAPSAIPASAVSASAAHVSVAPSPSTAVVDMSAVAPLVTSGPCAGLALAAYPESGVHPPVTAFSSAGVVLTTAGGQLLGLKAGGPCVDRLSYVQRTSTFQDLMNVPYSFPDGAGGIVTLSSPHNQTGVVQFFLDCKGLDCGSSGAPVTTLIVHISGTAPGAASATFAAAPTPIPLPTGEVVTIPSVLGLSPDAARQALSAAGLGSVGSNALNDTGIVTLQDPPAGSVVPKGSGDEFYVTGAQPFTPPPAPTAAAGVAPLSAVPSRAPGPAAVPMPSVIGLTKAKAEAVLTEAGISYTITNRYGNAPVGTVALQSPRANTTVVASTVVQLTVVEARPKP
jgi:hypothetical protein